MPNVLHIITLAFCFILLLNGCQPNQAPQVERDPSIDSLRLEIIQLRTVIESLGKDDKTAPLEIPIAKTVPKDTVTKPVLTPQKEPAVETSPDTLPPPKVAPQKEQPKETDTIFHYYTNGSISVKIHPWHEQKRMIELFDLYGKLTFSTKDIRHSYTVFNTLRFHPNGAVNTISESFNPGASLYMYSALMKFSTTNQPIIRTQEKTPSTLDEIMRERPWFWNKERWEWVQQEIVTETITPPEKE